MSVVTIQQTQLCAQGAAVLTVCLRRTVHVPSSSGPFLTATKPLVTPPNRVSFERITLAIVMLEIFMLYGFVDYFNLCISKSSPFVPVLSYPPFPPLPQPMYLSSFSILFSHQQLDLVIAVFPHHILCAFKQQCKNNSRRLLFWQLLEQIAYTCFENT
jgi:hypothetical protein